MHQKILLLFTTVIVATLSACSAAPAPQVEVSDAEAVAATTESLTKNALTPAQAKTTLRLIDNICGDTWCDGDYDFGFRRLTCSAHAATCDLTLQIFPREGVTATQHSYFRTCRTHDFTGFDSLVVTAPNGYQSLDQDYYMALTECISQLETKLP